MLRHHLFVWYYTPKIVLGEQVQGKRKTEPAVAYNKIAF